MSNDRFETDKQTRWDVVMNTAVTGVGAVKTFVDISLTNFKKDSGKVLSLWNTASPWAEMVINLVWQAPVIESLNVKHDTASSVVGFIGNTLFDAGGWITPGTAIGSEESKGIFLVAVTLCATIYGDMMMIQGPLIWYGK